VQNRDSGIGIEHKSSPFFHQREPDDVRRVLALM
jgi:hypothetical protein